MAGKDAAAARGDGEPHRHDHRVVRFLPLRLGRRAGLQPAVLPGVRPADGTLLAFATYAVGFVARPLGGIVFGHFGDRIGRKRLLMLSLVLMGVATVLIGLLPTYAQIGIWAPIALIVLRLVQGFAVGGEWGGAVLMAAEHGDAARRGFWASWPQAGVAAGSLLAAACWR